MQKDKTENTYLLAGDPPIGVEMRRSARARRFSLRIAHHDGRVSLTLPRWADEGEALAFLHAREDWLRLHLHRRPADLRPEIGGMIPVCGVDRPIVIGQGRAARFADGAIHLPPARPVGPMVAALLKALARERLTAASQKHAQNLGRPFHQITLRDPRSRWGSCSASGHLMYSWRLIMAPPEILDYVAAHEVAHLAEMNHGVKFWATCARLCPEYARHRHWLKTQGARILAWRFDSLPRSGEM